MWRELVRNVLLMSVFGAILSGAALPVQAAVRDDAGFFSHDAVEKANTRLAVLEKSFGKEVRIETFKTVPDGRGDEVAKMDKAARARYFEKWARDQATKERVKGFYILVCKHPGHVEVAEDRQTQNQGIGAKERGEVRDKLLAGFRHEKFDQGLTDAVDQLEHIFKEKLHGKTGSHAPLAAPHARGGTNHPLENHPAAGHGTGMGWLGWILVIGAVLLGIRLIGALFSGFGGGHPAGGGYGPGYGGGGGGFFGSLMTGMLGAFAGNWLYHSMFGGSEAFGHTGTFGGGDELRHGADDGAGEDFQTSGGDYGDDGSSGGDFGGDTGGDSGGDFGGGDFGGGDFGGGGDF